MCQLDGIVQTQEKEDERSHRMFWKGNLSYQSMLVISEFIASQIFFKVYCKTKLHCKSIF